jgi:hypothetical protein
MATELLKEHETGTGVGVDLFIRKNRPGPTIGAGYTIDVFENGIKADEIRLDDKKHVKDIINEYKSKYNTGRAFQNENQLHITYKTKEERGEDIINPEEQKVPEKREETAMQVIDQILIKKANTIKTCLQRLLDPTAPVIVKYSEEQKLPEINSDIVPQTPGGESAETAMNNAVKNAVGALVKMIKNNSDAEKDDLYNGMKHWISETKKNIGDWEKINKQIIDKVEFKDKLKDIMLSGDPVKIKNISGEDITPEQATSLKEVSLMSTGTPAQGQVSGGGVAGEAGIDTTEKSTLIGSLGKAASTDAKDKAVRILGETHGAPESNIVGTAENIIKELLGNDRETMDEIANMLPETFEGAAVGRAIQQIQDEADKKLKLEQKIDPVIEIKIKEFWENISRSKTAVTLDKAFESWINNERIELGIAQEIWKRINKEVDTIFKKEAQFLFPPDMYIKILAEEAFYRDILIPFLDSAESQYSTKGPEGYMAFIEEKIKPLVLSMLSVPRKRLSGNALLKELDNIIHILFINKFNDISGRQEHAAKELAAVLENTDYRSWI